MKGNGLGIIGTLTGKSRVGAPPVTHIMKAYRED